MRAVIFDLHTHTNASDGSLSPDELLLLATDNCVDALSITDHDTVQAYERLTSPPPGAPTVIPGIELSTTWGGRGIHIVGLNIDPTNPTLCRGIESQQIARLVRAKSISTRLTRLGFVHSFASVQDIAGTAGIGRPHFARMLVDNAYVKDTATAFRKFLGDGKPGDIRSGWASLDEVIQWIRSAGGVPVLAHPAKYKLTRTKLRCLFDDFVAAGGAAVEVVSGNQEESVTIRLAALARDFNLAASSGSDFHHPSLTWSAPGRFAPMPGDLQPVWELWPSA